MLLRSNVQVAFISRRWLLLLGLIFSVSTVCAEAPAVSNQISSVNSLSNNATSSAAVVQQDRVVSSLASAAQSSATEAVAPFYQKADAQQNATKTPPKIGSSGHLLNVALGLIAIVALIYVLAQFVKRFGGGTFSGNSQLKILSALPLGTRERIVLIDAGGQQLLLGITPTNINTLHVFAEPIIVDAKHEVQSDFSQKLMAILQQKQAKPSSKNKNDSAPQE